MLKVLVEKWDKNKDRLKEALSDVINNGIEYEDLVRLTFSTIYNDGDESIGYPYNKLDCDEITKIDNGDYQGTLLFLIPFETYQPSEYEYLMTYVGYGSCSGCDTLLAIVDYDNWGRKFSETQVEKLLTLCKDILTNTIKPYNAAWRENDKFNSVEVE